MRRTRVSVQAKLFEKPLRINWNSQHKLDPLQHIYSIYFSHISHDSMTVRSEFPLLNAQLNRNSLKIPPLKPHLLPLLRFFQSETPHLLKFSLPPLFVHLPKNPSFRLPPKPSQAWLHSNEALQIASLRPGRTASRGAAAPCHCSSRPCWSRCPEFRLRPQNDKSGWKKCWRRFPKRREAFLGVQLYSPYSHNLWWYSVVHVRSVTSHLSLWHLPWSIQYYLRSAFQLSISIWTCNPLSPKTAFFFKKHLAPGVVTWVVQVYPSGPPNASQTLLCANITTFQFKQLKKNMLILEMILGNNSVTNWYWNDFTIRIISTS